MPTVRVRRTPSDLCFLEWVSFYGGWRGLRESGFCRMGLHGRFTIVGFQDVPAASSAGDGLQLPVRSPGQEPPAFRGLFHRTTDGSAAR